MSRQWRLFLTTAILGLSTVFAGAAVPNRIVYQGRLSKSGVGVAGPHLFQAVFISSAGATLSSQTKNLTLPASGEFTLVLDGVTGINWLTDAPRLKISVDGEDLSPNEEFGVSPYAYVAQKVDASGVTTAALADGAVTDAKVAAAGLAAAKVKLSNNASLSSWEKPGTGKIDAAVIVGTVTSGSAHAATHRFGGTDSLSGLDRTQIQGTAIVLSTGSPQILQPSANVTPLQIKGNPGGLASLNMFEVWDNAATPAPIYTVRGDGTVSSNGPLGIGGTPAASLDVRGDPMNVALRNNGGTANQRAWTLTVAKPSGDISLNAVNDALAAPVAALTASRTGLVTISSLAVTAASMGGIQASGSVTANTLSAQTVTAVGGQFTNMTIGTLDNFPAFRVYNVGGIPSPTNALNNVTFNRIDFDTHNFFSNSDRYKPLIAGYYHFDYCVHVDFTAGPGDYGLGLSKNGQMVTRNIQYIPGINAQGLCGSTVQYANGSTDYFQVFVAHTGAPNRNIGYPNADPTLNSWSGHQIGRAHV
jgi:hypothetical protein